MFGLDDKIASIGTGEAFVIVALVAIMLGLRHATDPDHLAAVSTLIASEPEDGTRRAGRLGLAWGMGHATTLFVFGLPIVVAGAYLPDSVQRGAELLVGLVIIALATRLLVRWRRGRFHAHLHRHGHVEHRHLHPHGQSTHHAHTHAPELELGRSPRQAFGIGMVHGLGGSAGVGVLLLAGIPDRAEAAGALILFAVAAAVSMATLSSGLGYALTRGPVLRRMLALAPGLGLVTLVFGVWYAASAVSL